MNRTDLQFDVDGDSCAAWMYEPEQRTDESRPVVVMAHGLSGTRRDRLGPFAERFARHGCFALVFDHRGFGDSSGTPDLFEPRDSSRTGCARLRSRVAGLRSIPNGRDLRLVDGRRQRVAAAARAPRVAAAISQVPFRSIVRQAHRGSPRAMARIVLAAVRGEYIAAVGQPHKAAFIHAPGSEAGWRHVVTIGETSRWRDRVSTRWLLGRPFNPGRHAKRLHCPWLVCVGAADQVARPAAAIAAAKRARYGELRLYPGVDHFDIYDGPSTNAFLPTSSRCSSAAHYRQPLARPARRHATAVFPREIVASRGFLAAIEAGLPALASLRTLIVWADRDVAFRGKERARWQALLPNHTTVIPKGTGHYLQSDAPEEFAAAIADWYRSRQAAEAGAADRA